MASQSPHRLEAFLHAFPRQRQDAAPVAHNTPGAGDGWAIPFTPGRCRAPVVDNALTQVQLGELVGMSQRQIASFEIGRRRVPVSLGNPPVFSSRQKWNYAANANFCIGVMPPSAILGRSWL